MKSATVVTAMVCALAAAGPSWAGLLLYDGFDYTAGQPLAASPDPNGGNPNGQYNTQYSQYWRYAGGGTTNTAAPTIASGSLSVVGMPAAAGNSVAFDKTQLGSARTGVPTAPSSDTVYWSGFLRINSVTGLTSTTLAGQMLGGFNNTAGPGVLPSSAGGLLLIKKASSDPLDRTYWLGTGHSTNNADRVFAVSTPQMEGDTVFVVASYTYNPGTDDDVVKMWVNPSSATFGAASPPAESVMGDAAVLAGATSEPLRPALGGIASFHLRNVNTAGTPAESVQFDELRIGTDWASVTPEPASLALLALGGLAALRRRSANR